MTNPFNASIYSELRAEMRKDLRGTSHTRSAAAMKREADKRDAARAIVRERAAWLREEIESGAHGARRSHGSVLPGAPVGMESLT